MNVKVSVSKRIRRWAEVRSTAEFRPGGRASPRSRERFATSCGMLVLDQARNAALSARAKRANGALASCRLM